MKTNGPTMRVLAPCGVDAKRLPQSPVKILVADDEHLIAAGLAATLAGLGYAVVGPVADGDEAIEMCHAERPDLALLDVRMSRMDGLTAGSVIFHELGVPVLIFSAYSDPEYVDTGVQAGIFGYLIKPVSPDQLRVGISLAWGRYRDFMLQASEIEALRRRLDERKVIEQAKWVLVMKRGMTEPEAMKTLQGEARTTRRTLAEICRQVVANGTL